MWPSRDIESRTAGIQNSICLQDSFSKLETIVEMLLRHKTRQVLNCASKHEETSLEPGIPVGNKGQVQSHEVQPDKMLSQPCKQIPTNKLVATNLLLVWDALTSSRTPTSVVGIWLSVRSGSLPSCARVSSCLEEGFLAGCWQTNQFWTSRGDAKRRNISPVSSY